MQKPGIDFCHLINFFHGDTFAQRFGRVKKTQGIGADKLCLDKRPAVHHFPRQFLSETETADFQRTNGFLQRFLKGTADGHCFAHRFHRSGEKIFRLRKFFKRPARNFHHAVINGRFKRSHGFACDVVGNFIERVTHGKFRRDFGDGKSRGFGGQCRRTRDARIHFHHNHLAGLRMNGKLHVGTACFHADFAHDGNRGIAHRLILAVGERLRRSNGN